MVLGLGVRVQPTKTRVTTRKHSKSEHTAAPTSTQHNHHNTNEHGLPTKMANALKKIVPAIGVAAGGTWAALTSSNDE